jgi:hypothetical protein
MAKIEIQKVEEFPESKFEVTVHGNPVSKHEVTFTREYYEKLTSGAVTAEALVETSFKFLLAREPNTSILSAFDLTVISRYFPEYEREIKSKLRTS